MKPTIEQIIHDFSQTIFWNNHHAWPGPDRVEDLYPLQVRPKVPEGYTIHEFDGPLLRFASGELTVDVCAFPQQGGDADCENVTSEADAAFVASLPVYIPALLAEIQGLRDRVCALEEADRRSEAFCKELVCRCADGLHALHKGGAR